MGERLTLDTAFLELEEGDESSHNAHRLDDGLRPPAGGRRTVSSPAPIPRGG